MPKRPPIMTLLPLLPWVLAAWSQPAGALGLGKVQAQAVLGSPLALTVELKTEASDALTSECVDVVVYAGDAQVPRSAVSVLLDAVGPSPSLKIRTSRPMDEPLAKVQVSLGCGAKVQRNYQFLLDPPGYLAAPPVTQLGDVRSATGAVSPAVAQPVEPGGAAPTSPTPAEASTSAPATPSKPVTVAPAKPKVNKPKPPVSDRPAEGNGAKSDALGSNASKAVSSKATSAPTSVGAPSSQPQLKLEAGAGKDRKGLEAAALQAEREAALKAAEESAKQAEESAKQAAQRLADMDKALESLRQEAKANSEAVARLTAALAQAESRAQPAELPPLWAWGAMGGLLLLSGGLAWQLRRTQRRAAWAVGDSAFLGASADDSTGPSPDDSSAVQAGRSSASSTLTAEALAAASKLPSGDLGGAATPYVEPPLSEGERTQLNAPTGSTAAAPMRSVSIEELLDLEQQVEFFNVLGQDDEAISLLVEHLRKTGGTYPLPYLKLMETYRRREDREAYERIRERFNQRFNSVAAAWGAAPQSTRSLDEYPEAMARIEAIWHQPMDAMALLENMLFRTEGGEMLDLSALGDVLTLYTLARELHESEEGGGDTVDVLLPFGAVASASAAAAVANASDDDDALRALQALSGFGELEPEIPAKVKVGPAVPSPAASSELDLDIGSIFDMAEDTSNGSPIEATSGSSASSVSEEFIDFPLGEPLLGELFAEQSATPPATEPRSAPEPDPSGGLLDLPALELPSQVPQPAQETGPVATASSSFDLDLPSELSASQARLDEQLAEAPAVELDLSHLSLDFLDAPAEKAPQDASTVAPEASAPDIDFDIFGQASGEVGKPKG